MAKRARERARQAKREAKDARRESLAEDTTNLSAAGEQALLEEFAQLSARYEAKAISHDAYTQERLRILTDLGIEAG